MKLSAIIIAKNAEGLIADCLDSVAFADEIVVVDGGSTDKTTDIAKRMGAKVIKGVTQDFAQQREIGMEAARGTWLFYIDTDERVTTTLQNAVLDVVNEALHEYAAYRITRQNFYLGDHPWPKKEKLERLFLKANLQRWQGALHESAIVKGKIGGLAGELLHYTHRDLTSMLEKTIVWSQIEAQLRYDAHHPKMVEWRFIRVMLTAFYDSYIKQGGWKMGTAGFVESMYQAFSMFITYARLWEMQEKSS